MARGDAIDVLVAAAGGTHQPAAGVEEKITAIVMAGSTDALNLTDGSITLALLGAVNQPDQGLPLTGSVDIFNMSIMLTNSLHLVKAGTTDPAFVMGWTTNV